jgi:O-antigen/teichoic acid export membrane protein
MLKKLLSHSAIYGLAPSIPKIAGIFVLPIITKYLTNVDFGIAGTIAAYTGAISVFSTLGFNIVLTTSFYKHPYQYKWLWRQIYGFLQYWMVVFAVIQSIMLYFIIPVEAQEHKWEIIFYTNFATVFFGATSLLGTLQYHSNIYLTIGKN